ncbi:MAG: acyl carrier protein [Lachnospiraceae bacterium]|nr:acyl carrier protein [Lachnospiraceae bacterium]
MSNEKKFKEIIAQYSKVKPEEMTDEMRFREDLGFTSLDFMSFLGELEDSFDIELEEENAASVYTIGEALDLMNKLIEE